MNPARRVVVAGALTVGLLAASTVPAAAYTRQPGYWTWQICQLRASRHQPASSLIVYVGWVAPDAYPTAYAYTGRTKVGSTHIAWHPDGGSEAVGFIVEEGGRTWDKHNIGGTGPAARQADSYVSFTFQRVEGTIGRCYTRPLWPAASPPVWARR